MDYLYFPGCSLTTGARSYDRSARAVGRALGAELVELEDWNCCGSTAYLAVEGNRAMLLPSRNLALAEKQGAKTLLTLCPSCFTVLNKAKHYLSEDGQRRKEVGPALAEIGLGYEGKVQVRHFLDILINDVGLEAIRDRVVNPLTGLKVAPYYGCQIARPYGTFDDPEFPTSLDRLLTTIGAEPVDFPLKARCCGGMLMVTQPEVALKLNKELLTVATAAGAEIVATACPLCQLNLEAYQGEVNRRFGTNFSLPVVYFTQLLGLALGLSKEEVDLGRELVSAQEVLTRYMAKTSGGAEK